MTELPHILHAPADAAVLYVLAHGAGAPMRHPFMEAMAHALAERRVATLRYDFPYMAAGGRRPDPPARLEATVRKAVALAREQRPDLPLIAGGKSMGGRMTSQAQAGEPLPGVRGLVFLGFPLHAPGRPSDARAAHLSAVRLPMLFLQGTRDDFADLSLLSPIVEGLGRSATMHLVEGGDHSFKVLKRSGRTEAEVRAEMADAIARWAATLG